jgi:hypothetical protein
MSVSGRGWIYIMSIAIVIGLVVGFVVSPWWGTAAFLILLLGLPIVLIIVGMIGWMASGSH